MKKPSGHVFISYVHEDSKQVDRLQYALEAAGIPVWRDTSRLQSGEEWRQKITEAIEKDSLAVIVCFSSRSVSRTKSGQNVELRVAIDEFQTRPIGSRWIIPVRFDRCQIPDMALGGGQTLNSIQCVDLFGPDLDTALARLVAGILPLLERTSNTPRQEESELILSKIRAAWLEKLPQSELLNNNYTPVGLTLRGFRRIAHVFWRFSQDEDYR